MLGAGEPEPEAAQAAQEQASDQPSLADVLGAVNNLAGAVQQQGQQIADLSAEQEAVRGIMAKA